MATTEGDLNPWGMKKLLDMRDTDAIISRAMTGSTVSCILKPKLTAYEKARPSGVTEQELAVFRETVVRGRNTTRKKQASIGNEPNWWYN